MEIGGLTRRPVAIACHRIQWWGGIPDNARRSQTMHYSKLHPVRKQFATAWWSEVTESNCGRNNHWLHKVWDQRNFWFQSIASSVRTALKANIKALKSIPNLNWSQFNIMTFAANSPAQVDVITRYQTGLSSVPRGHHSNIMIVVKYVPLQHLHHAEVHWVRSKPVLGWCRLTRVTTSAGVVVTQCSSKIIRHSTRYITFMFALWCL